MTTTYNFTPPVGAPNAQVPSVVARVTAYGLNPVAVPASAGPFTFQPTLDNNQYTVTVTWSLFGQRFYVNCYTLSGVLVFSMPLIGSMIGTNLQAVSWDGNTGTVTATTNGPHGYEVGSVINLTVINCTPTAYNGTFAANVINKTQFTYDVASFPGAVAALGSVQYNINIAAGYFASTLIYRTENQQFEVSP
jgi:hypothetical protein